MEKPFEYYFNETNGLPFDYKGKVIKLSHRIDIIGGEIFRIDNLTTDSEWKQGMVLHSLNGKIEINGSIEKQFVLWEDTLPKNPSFKIISGEQLVVYNVWDIGNGVMQYGHNGAGLYVEEKNNRITFYCNDGHPDDNLNDLVFNLSKLVVV